MKEKVLEALKRELSFQRAYEEHPHKSKDIIIVIHNQVDYVKRCIDSVYENTENFDLYLWDNGSGKETRDYLESLDHKNLHLTRSESNKGFIKPNNDLVKGGCSDYIILLNSDTLVSDGWDRAMIGYLENNSKTKIVGYLGGLVDDEGNLVRTVHGADVDYVMGWCLCLPRSYYERYGLFDDGYKFAYFEDTDLSFRAKDNGYDIYALNVEYVLHAGNKTVKEVAEDRDLRETFLYNKDRFVSKWRPTQEEHDVEVSIYR